MQEAWVHNSDIDSCIAAQVAFQYSISSLSSQEIEAPHDNEIGRKLVPHLEKTLQQ